MSNAFAFRFKTKKTPNDVLGVFLFYVLSTRCGGEDTTYYSALAKHASASGRLLLFET